MQIKFNEEAMSRAMARVETLINFMGYERINPESLDALGDALAQDVEGVEFSYEDCRAYRLVMAGFRALLAPVEGA